MNDRIKRGSSCYDLSYIFGFFIALSKYIHAEVTSRLGWLAANNVGHNTN